MTYKNIHIIEQKYDGNTRNILHPFIFISCQNVFNTGVNKIKVLCFKNIIETFSELVSA